MLYIIAGVLLAILIYIVIAYNKLVRLRNLVREAWSSVDVQLKRRYDLIPNLVEAVKGYAGFEKNVLEEITSLRSSAESAETVMKQAEAENRISGGLKRFFALAENYPDLKASTSYSKLMEGLVDAEEQIQYARRYYNGTVRNYNTAVESFPDMVIANLFNFKQREFFEIELSTERAAPKVEDAI